MVGNYQKKVYVTQLKQAYSILNQVTQKMVADSGSEQWENNEMVAELSRDIGVINNSNWSSQVTREEYKDIVLKHMKKYINIVSVNKCEAGKCNYKYLNSQTGNSDNLYLFYTNSGMSFEFRFFTDDSNVGNYGYVNVDVNGLKKPNEWGKDIFQFYIWGDSSYIPCGSLQLAERLNDMKYYWKTIGSYAWSNCPDNKNSYGQGCTARVLEEDDITY